MELRMTIKEYYRFMRKQGFGHRHTICTCIAMYSKNVEQWHRRLMYFAKIWNAR